MREMLHDLLRSIYQWTDGITFEIILIDNSSHDGTVEMAKESFPDVHLIENRTNRGVAAARNQGFHSAKGRYVLTLDADMLLRDNALRVMVDFMDEHPDAGICGCKLISLDGEIQLNSRRFPTVRALFFRRLDFLPFIQRSQILRHHEMADWDRSDTRQVDYLIGACQMIRAEVQSDIGLLDENIFYGPEDLDYCIRAWRAGWKVYYVATTSIVHYEQRITRKKAFSKLTLLHLKGIFYLLRKYRWRVSPNKAS